MSVSIDGFLKEAYYYRETYKGVQCMICHHLCDLKEGQRGICHTRINIENKLYTEVYGRACALHIDPIEKKPLYHFHPGSTCLSVATVGCNLSCKNCQNSSISQAMPSSVKAVYLPPEELTEACTKNKCNSIAYTYTEPFTYYEYTLDSARLARKKKINNIVVSAGYINQEPLKELCQYIDAANIDLKSFDNDIYRRISHGTLQPVLNTLLTIKEAGVWLEITNLLIPSLNDDIDKIKDMCKWLVDNGFSDNPLHFSRFFPSYKLTELPPTPIKTIIEARDIALNAGIKYVYLGNVPQVDGENTYFPSCKKLIVDRKGYDVIDTHIINGKCEYCGYIIAGVF